MSRHQSPFRQTRYQEISVVLRDQIEDGEIKTGEKIPSEPQLVRDHQVSRATVRQAIELLEREGLLERRQGIGTFVLGRPDRSSEPKRIRISRPKTLRHLPNMPGKLVRTGTNLPKLRQIEALGLAPSQQAKFAIRELVYKKKKLAVKHVFTPSLEAFAEELAEGMHFYDNAARYLPAALECDAGWIDSVLAEPRFAEHLDVAIGAPLISVNWVDTMGGIPVLATQMLLPGASFTLEM